MKDKEKAEIKYRIDRLNRHGYTTIHLFGKWYLVRNWPKRGVNWYCKLPIYLPTYIYTTGLVSENDFPSTPSGEFR